MNRFLLLLIPVAFAQCRPAIPEEVPLPTKICVRTQHHTVPIPNAIVYLKYNADSFPGYDQTPAYFDASFYTGADARGCIESVPEGKHWLVAFGYDSLYFPHYVYGSLNTEISLRYKPVLDTILYISE
ncbi:MAG TPA: hypothetical protein VK168_15910 [Saprospiraceae bacterium]|nr:hypothetical protein [Saprospiraceae bacterium]